MSTVQTNRIQHSSASGNNIILSADGDTQVNSLNGGQLAGFRSMVINGDFAVTQRYTSKSNIGNGTDGWFADRIKFLNNTDAVCNINRKTGDGPPGQFYWGELSVATPDTDIGAAQFAVIQHKIEGFNFARANFGTPQAKKFTVSFWFKSTMVGQYAASIRNATGDKTFIHAVNVTTADTWQKVEFTVDPCTSGIWNYGNDIGAQLEIYPANGTTFQNNTTDSWISGQYFHATSNNVNFFSDVNTLGIAGIQIELGDTVTPYEYRDVATTVNQCQRYYEAGSGKIFVGGADGPTQGVALAVAFKVTKRTIPSDINYGTAGARSFIPTITEWIDVDTFGAQRQNSNECAFVWNVDVEL